MSKIKEITKQQQNETLNKLLGTSGVDYFAPSNSVNLIELQISKKLIVGRLIIVISLIILLLGLAFA